MEFRRAEDASALNNHRRNARNMSGSPNTTILFDSWTSQVEVQQTKPPRLETLFGLIEGNGWTTAFTQNPITQEQLLTATGEPIPGVLVILTRFNAPNRGLARFSADPFMVRGE